MPRFKRYNYDQDAMIVINYQDQLQHGTFEHPVHYLIKRNFDLSIFSANTTRLRAVGGGNKIETLASYGQLEA